MDSLSSEEIKILESSSIVRVSSTISVERYHNNRDSSEGSTRTAVVT